MLLGPVDLVAWEVVMTMWSRPWLWCHCEMYDWPPVFQHTVDTILGLCTNVRSPHQIFQAEIDAKGHAHSCMCSRQSQVASAKKGWAQSEIKLKLLYRFQPRDTKSVDEKEQPHCTDRPLHLMMLYNCMNSSVVISLSSQRLARTPSPAGQTLYSSEKQSSINVTHSLDHFFTKSLHRYFSILARHLIQSITPTFFKSWSWTSEWEVMSMIGFNNICKEDTRGWWLAQLTLLG